MKNFVKLLTAGMMMAAVVAPITAEAQSHSSREIRQRQKTKGEWQKAAYAGGALAILGQFNKDKTLSYIGAGTALYSLYRMQEDTKSQNRARRERAAFYNRSHYTRNGVRYDRKTVHKNGQTYYTFVRHR